MEFNFNKYFDYLSLECGKKNNLLTIEKLENYQRILKADNLYVIYASNYIEMRDRFDRVIANENPTDDYFVGKLVKVVEYSSTPFRVQSTDGGIIDCNEIYILDEDFINGKKDNATEKPAMKFDGSKIIDMSSPNLLQYLGKNFLGAYSIECLMDYIRGINSGRNTFEGRLIEFRPNERLAGFKLKRKDTLESVLVTYLYPLEDIETEIKQNISSKIRRLVIERDKDKVVVILLPNKDGRGYQYINLTKGHICPCVFPTIENALENLEKFQNLKKIKSWKKIPDKAKLEI